MHRSRFCFGAFRLAGLPMKPSPRSRGELTRHPGGRPRGGGLSSAPPPPSRAPHSAPCWWRLEIRNNLGSRDAAFREGWKRTFAAPGSPTPRPAGFTFQSDRYGVRSTTELNPSECERGSASSYGFIGCTDLPTCCSFEAFVYFFLAYLHYRYQSANVSYVFVSVNPLPFFLT